MGPPAGGPAASGHADGRNPWLDLLRSAAIALVMLRHGERAIAAPSGAGHGLLHNLAMNGWVGVDLFFVLSGYLIGRNLIRSGLGTARFVLWRYLAMRALRIVPAYLAVLALILASAFPLYTIERERLVARLAYHLLFLQDYFPSDINVVFWSLGVEEKFYLAAPALLWLVLSRGTLARGLLVLLAAGSFCSVARAASYLAGAPADYAGFFGELRSPFHASLEPLLVGTAIAVAQHAGAVRPSPAWGAGLLAGAALALAGWLGTTDLMGAITAADATAQPPAIACLCGLLTLGAVRLAGVPMPARAAAGAVARLSYCLYLVHYPLLPLAVATAGAGGGAAVVPTFWLTYLASSLAAASLLHHGVERPFLALKDRLARNGREEPSGGHPDTDPGAARVGRRTALPASDP